MQGHGLRHSVPLGQARMIVTQHMLMGVLSMLMGVLSNMVGKGLIKSVTSQHGHFCSLWWPAHHVSP